jgi:hypothetical protein
LDGLNLNKKSEFINLNNLKYNIYG